MARPRRNISENHQLAAFFPNLRRYAKPVKEYLRRHGHEWTFYDSLDSYAAEYGALTAWALERVDSLAAVHECSVGEFYGPEQKLHKKLGIDRWEPLCFTPVDVGDEYGVCAEPRPGVTAARTQAFRDENGDLRTVIFIVRKASGATSAEISAGLKIPPLLHEVGHALDWHEGMHLHEGEVRIVDAEIYAHRFALHQCLDRQYYVSLQCYVEGLAKMAESGSYEKEVYHALRDCGLIDECRAAQENAWWKVLRTLTPTPEDLEMLAPLAELSR